MHIQHLSQNNNGTYIYRRRIPNELQNIVQKSTIKISLGKEVSLAITKANQYTQVIQQSIQVSGMEMIEDEKNNLIFNLLKPLGFNPAIQKSIIPLWQTICIDYIKTQDPLSGELQPKSYFFFTIAPAIFKLILKKNNPNLNNISFTHLLDFQALIDTLPKRNIQKYRDINFEILISQVTQKQIDIKDNELLATRTKNKYMKWLKAIFQFAYIRDLINKDFTKAIVLKNTTNQRDEKLALTQQELKLLYKAIDNDKLAFLFKVLHLTGMRRSELYKCSIKSYDGVLCFDLLTPVEKLKTISSYRLIPVHASLLPMINELDSIRNTYVGTYLTQYFSKLIKKNLTEIKGKSLYSLRHCYATELIAKGVMPEIVSELMGHSHKTITMNRYVKSYPIEILNESISRLESIS